MAAKRMNEIRAQAGPQECFLSTTADIAFYGGAAGGGKTFALLLEPLRHLENKDFGGVIFRRNSVQVRNEGGLWDESMKLYSLVGGHPRENFLDWSFPSKMSITFSHLQYDKTVHDWQGSQIPYLGFDEITHFTEKQFWYMISRNRSTSGVAGYVRATCNPDADSWVAGLISWWIDQKTGYAIPERSGVIRWFIRADDVTHWADTKEELIEKFGGAHIPKSFTFISASLKDNKILMEKDPSYLANLMSQSKVDRERLLDGNWKIRYTAGEVFNRTWFKVVDHIPDGWISCIRFWDRAATKPNPQNPDPDWTRGLKLYKYPDGRCLVAHLESARESAGKIETLIKNTASQDGYGCSIGVQQDAGSAGKGEIETFVKMLAGYTVEILKTTDDKLTRAKPVSAQAEHGNILVLKGDWNEEFFKELENFPSKGYHDDIVDVLSGAYLKGKSTESFFG